MALKPVHARYGLISGHVSTKAHCPFVCPRRGSSKLEGHKLSFKRLIWYISLPIVSKDANWQFGLRCCELLLQERPGDDAHGGEQMCARIVYSTHWPLFARGLGDIQMMYAAS